METAIKEPTICEKCGANQDLVFEMAQEEFGSENFSIAWKILKNCQECKEAYRVKLKNI